MIVAINEGNPNKFRSYFSDGLGEFSNEEIVSFMIQFSDRFPDVILVEFEDGQDVHQIVPWIVTQLENEKGSWVDKRNVNHTWFITGSDRTAGQLQFQMCGSFNKICGVRVLTHGHPHDHANYEK